MARRWLVLSIALAMTAVTLRAQPPPELTIEAPAALTPARHRLETFDRASLAGIVRMVGLEQPGAAIHVILSPEDSAAAKMVGPSVAGYAISSQALVVLFPARSPAYPHDTLEDVMRHEVAHVLIGRAAGGRPVPRWFHEGLAMAVERPWGLEDRSRLILELVAGPRLSVAEIDRLFDDENTRSRAYALSAAMVREIIRAHGAASPAAILRQLRIAATFDEAMIRAVDRPMRDVERDFWDRQRVWTVWVPLLTSSEVLWLAMIVLAAVAVWHRRRAAAAIRRRWEEEDALEERIERSSDQIDHSPDHEVNR